MKIKSSKISLKYSNISKFFILKNIINEYKKAVTFYVDYLWDNKIEYPSKNGIKIFDVKNKKYDSPQFISTIEYNSNLSGRLLSAASTQACSMVSAALVKHKKCLYLLNKQNESKQRTRKLTKLLAKNILIKPKCDNINLELDAKNINIISDINLKSFDGIVQLHALGLKRGLKVNIPFKHTKHSRKLEKNGKLLSGVSLNEKELILRYEYQPPTKSSSNIVGADSGINSVIMLSDSQSSGPCKHGHTLNSILKKISNKKKGSKAFHKALDHRDNYIRYSINQLNLTDIKQINLEKVSNFRYKNNVGKFLNYSGEALIRSKLIDFAEDQGVLVSLQSSAYRSQRCSYCGYVSSKNRKGKLFSCKNCSFQSDADLNASLNHEQELPSANFLLLHRGKIKEFIWKNDGFFNLNGSELIVPDTK